MRSKFARKAFLFAVLEFAEFAQDERLAIRGRSNIAVVRGNGGQRLL
jgi:hypothetical protein